jgi:soluble P-type ATPase
MYDLLPYEDHKKDEQGVSGKVNGVPVVVGSLTHLKSRGIIKVNQQFKKQEKINADHGKSSVYVALNGKCEAVVALTHEISPMAKKTIWELHKRKIDVFMVTGDKREPAKAVAKALGIKKVYSDLGSQEKARLISNLSKNYESIMMVGDGMNDIPAMKEAKVSVAVGPWTDASTAAHISIKNIDVLPTLIIAKETMKNIHQNLYWSFFYNAIFCFFATGIMSLLFGWPILLTPWLASAIMGGSSLGVIINAGRLPYEIDEALGVYEGRIPPPKNIIERIVRFFSLTSLIKALSNLLSFDAEQKEEEQIDATQPATNVTDKSYAQVHYRTRAVKQEKPEVIDLEKEPSPMPSSAMSMRRPIAV